MIRSFLIISVVLALVSVVVQAQAADIFGLKRGMSVSEIRPLGFGNLEPFPDQSGESGYFVENPKKRIVPYPKFIFFYFPPPSHSLLKVAFVFNVKTENYGLEVQQKYRKLRDILKKKYGQGKESDYLRSEAEGVMTRPDFYVEALVKGLRILKWEKKDFPINNKWELEGVVVSTQAISSRDVNVMVVYQFKGWSSYIDKRESEF